MKILKLRFQNINSFYGKSYTIDFTAPPLSETGLFIISGATGAGKSTLLDVITLALYNEVPRFDKGISKTEIDKLGSIVNVKAAEEPRCEAFAEVEYEVRSGRYRSSWSIAKNRNGNWNNYQMEIARLPEEALLEVKGLSDYPKKNTELIGLNYGQFVKSIVLAQGSFAEFLKADRHTRTKLLEDITGTHIYRRLGEEAYERFKESAAKIRIKEEVLKGVVLRPEEETAQLNAKKAEKEEIRGKVEKELAVWENERTLVASISELQNIAARIGNEKLNLVRDSEVFESKQLQLAAHESVSHLIGPMTEFEGLRKHYAQVSANLELGKKEQLQIEAERIRLIQVGKALISDEISEESLVIEVNRFESEILEIETEVRGLRAQAKPVADAITADLLPVDFVWKKTISFTEYEQSLATLAHIKEELSKALSVYPDQFDASESLKRLDDHFEILSELKNLAGERERLGNEGKKAKIELESVRERVTTTEPELRVVTEQLSELKKNVELLTEQLIRETRKQNLTEQRDQLKEGEPCPLCGSEHHPFLHTYVNRVSSVAGDLENARKDVIRVEKLEKSLSLTLETSKKKSAELNDLLAAMRRDYKSADIRIREFLLKVGLNTEASREDILANLKTVQEEKLVIDRWIKSRNELRLLERVETNFRNLLTIRNQVKNLEEQKRKKYNGDNIQTEVKNLLSRWGSVLSSRTENQRQLTLLEADRVNIKAEFDQHETKLLASLGAVKLSSIDDARKRLLSHVDYEKLKYEEKKLSERRHSLSVQEEDNSKLLREKADSRVFPELTLDELAKKIDDLKLSYRTFVGEIAALQTTLQIEAENKIRFDTLIGELAADRKEHARWELLKQYIGDATGNLFSSFAQSLTLSNLIGLANARLQNLSDRYVLDKPRNDSDGLFVLDTYHGNQARAVSTLSGGETFTVSLALALALSDLASRNVRIESLFIDEGFGTLDADTLESAVSILERLQDESNKTVGVISHRQEMKERIPVQILVDKGTDGTSTIKIAG